jgi:energy-coupling factor transport system substrate-specific component
MLGTVMFISKLVMELLPNIHLLGTLTMVYTLVYRKRALIPIYVYVFLNGLYAGFSLWWIPYLYIWALLWGVTMLLPRRVNSRLSYVLYPAVNAIFGLAFGALYSPAQALMFGLDFKATLSWIVAGLPFDLIHAASNLALGLLIPLLYSHLHRLSKRIGIIE